MKSILGRNLWGLLNGSTSACLQLFICGSNFLFNLVISLISMLNMINICFIKCLCFNYVKLIKVVKRHQLK